MSQDPEKDISAHPEQPDDTEASPPAKRFANARAKVGARKAQIVTAFKEITANFLGSKPSREDVEMGALSAQLDALDETTTGFFPDNFTGTYEAPGKATGDMLFDSMADAATVRETIDTFRTPEERYSEEGIIKLSRHIRTDVSRGGSLGVSSLPAVIGERPDLIAQMVSVSTGEDMEEWDKVAVKAALQAASSIVAQRNVVTSGFGADYKDTSDPELVAADREEAATIRSHASGILSDVDDPEKLLREYGQYSNQGVSVATARLHNTCRDKSNSIDAPTLEDITFLAEHYGPASEATKLLLHQQKYNLRDVLEAEQYFGALHFKESESEYARVDKIEAVAGMLGLDEKYDPDAAEKLREGVVDLLDRGASVDGLAEMFPDVNDYKAFLDRDLGEKSEQIRDMLAVIAGLKDFKYTKVEPEYLVRTISEYPEEYAKATEIIKEQWDRTLASGYSSDLASIGIGSIFSKYGQNQWATYGQGGPYEDDYTANYVDAHFKAMQLLGNSSSRLLRLSLDGEPEYDSFAIRLAETIHRHPEEMSAITTEEIREPINADANRLQEISSGYTEVYQALLTQTDIKNTQDFDKIHEYIEKAEAFTRDPLLSTFATRLQEVGYSIDFSDTELLRSLLPNQERLFADIATIRQLHPDFTYDLRRRYVDLEKNRQVAYTDPYELFAVKTDAQTYLSLMGKELEDKGEIPSRYIDAYRTVQRKNNWGQNRHEIMFDEIHAERFTDAFRRLVRETQHPEGTLTEYEDFFANEHVLNALTRQPEKADEIFSIPENVPELFDLIQPGGPLYTNRDIIIADIFSNGNAIGRSREIASIFTKKVPYWKQLYLFTDTRIGDKLASAESRYRIADVPKLHQPDREVFDFSSDFSFIERPIVEMTVDEKRSVALLGEYTDEDVAAITEVPFAQLRGEYKKILFAHLLAETVEGSRSLDNKSAADARNRRSRGSLVLEPGMYIHGSAITLLDSVLLNGNLPKEALGEGAGIDSYPFHTDFSRLTASHIKANKTIESAITNTITGRGNYGARGSLGIEGQIMYVYNRDAASYQAGNEYSAGGREDHALVLGGMPATEVSGIILRNPDVTLSQARQSIVENGFYIPLYDMQGNLLFASEEYDSIVEDLNLRVPVEVWDTSMKTGGKLGSNEGSSFTISTEHGPESWYVKYATEEEAAHIWTEKISDDIYRLFDIPVPETRIVKVEGSYGHASKWLDGEHKGVSEVKALETWNKGFLVDALMANWDIPYAPDRNAFVGSDGHVYRLDNGGALLFNATGKRKAPELFSEEVRELQRGSDHSRLGLGMRQEYPGLTDDNVREQAQLMQELLTDEKIDEIVEGARLSKNDRDKLKQTLKLRRDYTLRTILPEAA